MTGTDVGIAAAKQQTRTIPIARSLRLQSQAIEVGRDADLDGALAAVTSGRAQALGRTIPLSLLQRANYVIR